MKNSLRPHTPHWWSTVLLLRSAPEGWTFFTSNLNRPLLQAIALPKRWEECGELKKAVFCTDQEAIDFVARRAAEGSELHIRAMKMFMAHKLTSANDR